MRDAKKYAFRLGLNYISYKVRTEQEVKDLDQMLDTVPMSEVFGGSRVEDKN